MGFKIKTKDGVIKKKYLLHLISKIKKLCAPKLTPLRVKFRNARREHFYDEETYYANLLEEYNAEVLQILEQGTDAVLSQYNITKEQFDESVKVLYEDPDVCNAINTMGTIEENAQAPDITKEQLLEILAFNNDKFVEALNNQRKEEIKYELLSAKTEDETFFKYGLESEEIAAAYAKLRNCFFSDYWLINILKNKDCGEDPQFASQLEELNKSHSEFLSPKFKHSPVKFESN